MLVIAVNEINEELHQIVRYIAEAGSPSFDFAALELRRFQADQTEILVPHVFGPVHAATKPTRAVRLWDKASFFEELEDRCGTDAVAPALRLYEWGNTAPNSVLWGKGNVTGSFVPYLMHNGRQHQHFAVYTNGAVELYFSWYRRKPPFDDDSMRLQLLRKLNEVEGVSVPEDALNRRPSIPLPTLAVSASLEKFLSVMDWMLKQIQAT